MRHVFWRAWLSLRVFAAQWYVPTPGSWTKVKANSTGVAVWTASVLLLSSTSSFAQLTVDRASGAISFALSESAEVKGYLIASDNGLLSPDAWNSLSDQGIEGWVEANPRNQMLAELNPFGSSDPAASPFNLGSAWAGTTRPASEEDLLFQYNTADGSVLDGTVNYMGPINDLVLRVDPSSGAANLELLSANVGPFDIIGYSIFSDSGSLAAGNLTGLGEGWTAASPTSTAVAELRLEGSQLFETNSTAAIGNIFTPGSEQDLRFEFATAGLDLLQGSVTYGSVVIVTTCADVRASRAIDGDLNGDNAVNFTDFLVLSSNFNTSQTDYEQGDIDCNGTVAFSDFLVLSTNFNQTAGATAASVPEPSAASLAVFAACLLPVVLRRRVLPAAVVLAIGLLGLSSVGSNSAMALDFNTRIVVLDPANPGPNATIDSALEARGILNGTVTNVNIAEDVTGTVDVIDFAGGSGAIGIDNPYPNGVNDESQNDFAVHVNGFLEIPEGNWNIGFNSDDGGILTMPRVNFLTKTNENAPTGAAGELIFNAPRGAGTWTAGSFTVPSGTTLRTEFEVIMFERGGGDLLEVAILDGVVESNNDWNQFGIELGDGAEGWTLLENGPSAGDFNWDDSVDFADFLVLANNFGTGTSFAQGDNNGDGRVDLFDFAELTPLLTAPANAAAVPEPASVWLLSFASTGLLLTLRRRRRFSLVSN